MRVIMTYDSVNITIKPAEKVTKYGVNELIKAHILEDETMKKIGFRKLDNYWYYAVTLFDSISFNVTIYNNLDLEIDVLDDDFCQPYDYQMILRKAPSFKPAVRAFKLVEIEMEYLTNCGVISGHNYGEYI